MLNPPFSPLKPSVSHLGADHDEADLPALQQVAGAEIRIEETQVLGRNVKWWGRGWLDDEYIYIYIIYDLIP